MIVLGSGLAAAAKITGVVVSYYVAWTAYSTMPETELRRRMFKMFKAGELGKKIKRNGAKGAMKEIIIYPKIQRVTSSLERNQIIFTVPMGLNPKDIFEHDWLFQQAFGEHIELEGNIKGVKTFMLNVYREGIQQFDYDAQEALKAIEGLRLPIYVGKGRSGSVAYDMTENPHLLMAGETGSGKSVELRNILTTIICNVGDKVDLYCADLKRSEFHLFRDIARAVVYDAPQLWQILLWISKDMKKRGDLLNKEGLAHVDDLPADKKPKYIVLAIDEVSLLKKEKCMDIIEEISAIGRALGVFLILSMQRPDADVLDGKLKNNLTVRMAFRHADEINSRITIGSGEAAHIKQSQKGLMIHKLDGIRYVQAPYLDIPKARVLLESFKTVIPGPGKNKSKSDQSIDEVVENYKKAMEEVDEEDIELGVL